MDTQAYGQLCQFLPGLLSPIFAIAIGAFDDADDSLRETADKLRAVVAGTTSTDDLTSQNVRAAGGGPGPLPELPL
ncbi:hypothetical protein [Winogradskya humida]|nr:hypothetical protein [Actinoplanes humidus]